MIKKSLLLVLLTFAVAGYAQQNMVYHDHNDQFKQGVELIEKHKYLQAKRAFEKYLNQRPDLVKKMEAEYYISICAIRLEEPDAEFLVNEFLEEHPNHPKANFVKVEYGSDLYFKKEYSKAINYLADVDFSIFDNEESNESRFKLGYCYFVEKNLPAAETQFDRIKNYNHKYTYAASYYSGNIKLKNKNYDQALTDFTLAGESGAYKTIVPYIITTIYYQQGNNDSLISYAERTLSLGGKVKNEIEIRLLLGEAYYAQPNYKKASENLSIYVKSKKGNADKEVQYKLGYALFQQENCSEATPFLEAAAVEDDSTGQYASYYVAQCYLKSNDKQKAINALEKAKSLDFSLGIKEESTFELAKIYYEKGDFNKVINLCMAFRADYPKSTHIAKVDELVSEAFFNSNDYEAAIAYIEGLPNQSNPKLKAIHQKVTYYHGVNLFNQQRYAEATTLFATSIFDAPNLQLKIAAYYYWAECYSVQEKWAKAISKYAKVFEKSKPSLSPFHLKAHYGIGYAYYNTGEVKKALAKFKYYAQNIDKEDPFYGDALLRLGDCYFYTGDRDLALSTYESALAANVKNRAYAHLQLGELYKRKSDEGNTIKNFDAVINDFPNSPYKGEARFRKALFYFKTANFEKSAELYNTFLEEEDKHPKYGKALLNRGISYQNLKRIDEAISDFDLILNEFCVDSALAKEALLAIEDVLTPEGKIDEYNTRLEKYLDCHPGDSDNQQMQYRVARNLYESGKNLSAISAFEKYLNNYPDAPEKAQTLYYLANCNLQIDSVEMAKFYFDKVLIDGQQKHYEAALYRLTEIAVVEHDFEAISRYGSELKSISTNSKRKLFATTALMKAYFEAEKYDSTIVYASNVLNSENTVISAKNEALFLKGKSHYFLENYDEAKDELVNIVNTSRLEDGAEANYFIGLILRNQEKFEESNNVLYDLSTNYSSYAKWYEEAFVLIAENYLSMGEKEHAILTLQSVIEYGTLPDVLERVNQRLLELNEEDKTEELDGSIDLVEEEIAVDSTNNVQGEEVENVD